MKDDRVAFEECLARFVLELLTIRVGKICVGSRARNGLLLDLAIDSPSNI